MELRVAKEEIEKLKVEAQASKDHMQQVLIVLLEVFSFFNA